MKFRVRAFDEPVIHIVEIENNANPEHVYAAIFEECALDQINVNTLKIEVKIAKGWYRNLWGLLANPLFQFQNEEVYEVRITKITPIADFLYFVFWIWLWMYMIYYINNELEITKDEEHEKFLVFVKHILYLFMGIFGLNAVGIIE